MKCVYGNYPSRLLDLWDLYDECKCSENDNPAILPSDQQYIVLELANAGQDLESYQFNNAEQAYALFIQVLVNIYFINLFLKFIVLFLYILIMLVHDFYNYFFLLSILTIHPLYGIC